MMRPRVKVQPGLGDYRRHNRSTKPPNQARFKGTGGIRVRDNGILTMHQLVFAMLVQGGTRKEGYKNKICDVIDFLDTCCSWMSVASQTCAFNHVWVEKKSDRVAES